MTTSPIKRSKHILPLSREHHLTLLFCWKIRQGLKNNTDPLRIKKYVDYFWQQHMKEHFRQEEELLFTKVKDELTMQAAADHERIRNIILRLEDTVSRPLLADLAQSVDDHVRFEERFLFNHFEKKIPETELEAIALKLNDEVVPDDFADEFWK